MQASTVHTDNIESNISVFPFSDTNKLVVNDLCTSGQAESNEMAPRNGMAGMDNDRPRIQVCCNSGC
jgi:hypothetical protein